MTNTTWDAIIVGAGAAGLMAATSAALRGRRVLVLEKNRKIGVKILMSGGTRCNITHHATPREIATAFGRNGKFLHSPLASLPPNEVIRMIEAEGVETKVESTGKIFPVSNSAVDVRDALVRLAVNAGAVIKTEQPVESIERPKTTDDQPKFSVLTPSGSFHSARLIITTGGKSYPGCGTTGDGYAWAKQFGHSIIHPVPALTPITCNTEWANDLKGITIDDVELSIIERQTFPPNSPPGDLPNQPDAHPKEKSAKKRKPIGSERGSFLFTHFGFSGPSVLNASRMISRRESPAGLTCKLDFLPNHRSQELIENLQLITQSDGKQLPVTTLTQWLPRRLAEIILSNANVSPQTNNSELSKRQLNRIVEEIKSCQLPVSGILGFKKAEVTAGGVNLAEISSKTMESKLVPGLFFAGEVIDLDGKIGGFNFQAAFSTGWLAGQNI